MIKTGKKPISILTYLAIMSICFVINLPGIAVAPMEAKLETMLHAPELEIQLLTTLPNFVIIPFVLIASKLSESKDKLWWIIGALLLYLLCAVGYLFLPGMADLIIVSCLLGCANGILVPFAMVFVVNTFYGKYRTRHLGVKSATSNLGVVFGSFAVGWLIESKDWHLPFLVYLAILFPLAFSFWIKDIPALYVADDTFAEGVEDDGVKSKKGIDMPRVWGLIGNNVGFSFIAMAIMIFLPQLVEVYGWSSAIAGEMTSVFFIFVLAAGFIIVPLVRFFRQYTYFFLGVLLLSGLTLITFVPHKWAFFIGCALAGVGFGIFQPLTYDKTSYTVNRPSKAIAALSYVLAALYTAIAVEPFIISGLTRLFHIQDENYFVFRLSFFLAIAYVAIAFFFKKKFAFSIEKAYLSEPE